MLDANQRRRFQDAVALHHQARFDDAARIYRDLLAAWPDDADILQLLGVLRHQVGHHHDAIALMERSLALNPHQPAVLLNLGGALNAVGRDDDALTRYGDAIALKPDYADAYYSRATILHGMGRLDAALDDYNQAVRLNPRAPETYLNRGNLFKAVRRHDYALKDYQSALRLRPDYAEALNNMGAVLEEVARHDDALVYYRRAVAVNPHYGEAFANLGGLLRKRRSHDEALQAYQTAMALQPALPFLPGVVLHAKQHVCDWSGLDADMERVLNGVDRGEPCASPFILLATPASPAAQRKCTALYAERVYPHVAEPCWKGERYAHDKIRVGYFSADFHNHATTYLMAEFFERHDRSRFEVYGFSWGAAEHSDMRSRVEAAFDRLIDVQSHSDREVAVTARRLELDIAVDLKGYTDGGRPGIFAHRPAPVQVSYIGYPGTLATAHIDYLVADAIVIPPDQRLHYGECIAYLPETYRANDSTLAISDRPFARKDLGLPENAVVFGCFNNNYKISPELFDIWMRLLSRVPGSVLWLLEGNPAVKQNLQREAVRRGIAADRLVFGGRLPPQDHLARHRCADLFLDTFFCNGHTTTSDALWAGVPVVTWPSETFAGRVAASLLSALGLPELIAESPAGYEALALDLALNPERLAQLSAKLAAHRKTWPLFDTPRFTRHFEAACVQMWRRAEDGLAPTDIVVKPASST